MMIAVLNEDVRLAEVREELKASIDSEVEKLGGKPGEFEVCAGRYSWNLGMDEALGYAQECAPGYAVTRRYDGPDDELFVFTPQQ